LRCRPPLEGGGQRRQPLGVGPRVRLRVGGADLGRGGDACRGTSAAAGLNNNAGVAGDCGGARPSTVASSGDDICGFGDACNGASAAPTLGGEAMRAAARRRRRAATTTRACRKIAAPPAHRCWRAAAATFGGWATRAAARRGRREGPPHPTDDAAATLFVEFPSYPSGSGGLSSRGGTPAVSRGLERRRRGRIRPGCPRRR